jgi:hypothetical protein
MASRCVSKSLSAWSPPSSRRNRAWGVACHHLAPVQHFVSLGDDGQLGPGRGLAAQVQRAQLLHVLGPEEKTLLGLVPGGLFADVALQVAGRIHRRIQQHTRTVGLACHPGGVVAAQRRAHHGHLAARPLGDALGHLLHGQARRGGELGAPEVQSWVVLGHMLRHAPGLGRLGGGAKTVQVEQMGCGHGATKRGAGANTGTKRKRRHKMCEQTVTNPGPRCPILPRSPLPSAC